MHGVGANAGDRFPPIHAGAHAADKTFYRLPKEKGGSSVGERAAERFQQKCRLKAAVVRAERAEQLSTHLLKANDGGASRVANEQEKQQIAVLLNQRMVDIFPDPQARSWYKLFVHMDDDLSGKINFHELEDMVRNELKLLPSKLSEDLLKAVWRALDEDRSGLITTGEFGRFMRLGAHIHEKDASWKERFVHARVASGSATRQELKALLAGAVESRKAAQKARAERTSQFRNAEVGRAAASVAAVSQQKANSARLLRQERDEHLHRHLFKGKDGSSSSGRVASSAECEQIAILLNKRMAEIILDTQARSWYKLFVHMDDDCSGKINFHELEDMIRNELKLTRDRISDDQLKALWLALDEDKSGLITSGEFGHFMRRGLSVHEVIDPPADKLLRAKKAQGVVLRQEKVARLQEVHDCRAAEKAAKQSHATELHDVMWGLLPADPKPAWKSPRALVF
jgi:Ca2+-binding EF-hand superfamily protein